MKPTTEQINLAAAAIANARGGRRGMPPVVNVLDMLPANLVEEVTEDARAALEAAGCHPPAINADALMSRKPSGRRNSVTMQQLLDVGINAFGFELVAESINGHRGRNLFAKPVSFVLRDVFFTVSLAPDRDWSHEEVREILEGLARIETMDTYLVRFARVFVSADDEDRALLTQSAVRFIDRYYLWKPAQPGESRRGE